MFHRHKKLACEIGLNRSKKEGKSFSRSEVIQISLIALWKLDESRIKSDGELFVMLRKTIRNDLIDAIRTRGHSMSGCKRKPQNMPKDIRSYVDYIDRDNVDSVLDNIEDEKTPDKDIEKREREETLQSFLKSTKSVAQHKQIFELLMDDYSQADIARIIGLSEGRISQVIKGVITRWQKKYLRRQI